MLLSLLKNKKVLFTMALIKGFSIYCELDIQYEDNNIMRFWTLSFTCKKDIFK